MLRISNFLTTLFSYFEWVNDSRISKTPDLLGEESTTCIPILRIRPQPKRPGYTKLPPHKCLGDPSKRFQNKNARKVNFSVVYCATLETSAWGYDWSERAFPESIPIGSHPSPRCGVWNYTSRTTIPAWIPRGDSWYKRADRDLPLPVVVPQRNPWPFVRLGIVTEPFLMWGRVSSSLLSIFHDRVRKTKQCVSSRICCFLTMTH